MSISIGIGISSAFIDGESVAPVAAFIITEGSDFIITESGDFVIRE